MHEHSEAPAPRSTPSRLVHAVWIVAALCVVGRSQDLVIDEFMAENKATVFDEDGDSSDWIEIRNAAAAAVDLGGWHLTDDAAEPMKWRFPTMVLGAGQRLLVFASAENRRDPAGELHTNFKLERSGEYLALTDPAGEVADGFAPTFPHQLEDVSYGRDTAGGLGFLTTPTPGAANGSASTTLPPHIGEVTDRPGQIVPGDAITVTARVTQTSGLISQVLCHYRVMFGAENTMPMSYQGAGWYAATVPTGGMQAGEMIRWRVEARDTAGRIGEAPRFDDPLDRDRYYGTIATNAALLSSNLPILHWFVADPSAAGTVAGTRGSVFYGGRFYDNVTTDLHGQSTAHFDKKSYDFDFNKGNRFKWRAGEGKVKDFNLLTNWADKSKVRNTFAYETLALAGAPHHYAFPVRVQQNAVFFSVADMVEDGDEDFLDRVGLDGDGALYKMYNGLTSATGGVEKKTRKHEDNSDLQEFIEGVNGADPVTFLHDHLDFARTVNVFAGTCVASISDNGHKNYYMYRDSDGSGEWTWLAWDVDLSAGRTWSSVDGYSSDTLTTTQGLIYWPTGNPLKHAIWDTPYLKDMVARRVRTLADQLVATGHYERRTQEMLDQIDPPGVTSDADLDFNKWGSWGNGNNMAQACARLGTDYLVPRRAFVYGALGLPDAQPAAPAMQFGAVDVLPVSGNQLEEYIEIVNPNAFAVDLSGWSVTGAVRHTFVPGTVVPASGSGHNTLHLVKDPVAFRARATGPGGGQGLLVQGSYDGQLSTRGETLYLVAPGTNTVASKTWAGAPSPAQQQLRVTELHYHPAAPSPDERAADPGLTADEFEFVEMQNTGPDPLDLGGVRLLEGIRFTFAAGTSLGAGEFLVLAKNPAAFDQRYGAVPNRFGPYEGYLSNGGERIQILDAFAEPVLDFTYDDLWFPQTDGLGTSLEIVDPLGPIDDWDRADGWRAMGGPHGYPGAFGGLLLVDPVALVSQDELQTLTLSVTATDTRQPPLPLSFALMDPPAAATIDSDTGAFSWRPRENQGPGDYTIGVVVSDGTGRSSTGVLAITVNEVNRPPVIADPGPQVLVEGFAWELVLTATDADRPRQDLQWSLVSGAPAGLWLGTNSGSMVWTPPSGSAGGSHAVQVRATDSLGGTRDRTLALSVIGLPRIESKVMLGEGDIGFDTVSGQVYTVECKDALDQVDWMVVGTVTASAPQVVVSDPKGAGRPRRYYRIRLRP